MKYVKIILISLICFGVSFLGGTMLSIWKFPRQEFQRVAAKNIEKIGSTWTFGHKKEVAKPNDKIIVKPAIDFLYSFATLKGEMGAHVLSIPPIDRYFVFQFMEDDTDVFDYISSRTHGQNKAIEILITPPGYTGETKGLETLELKTNDVWVLARFQIFEEADAENIWKIQDAISFTPLKEWKR